MRMGRSTDNGGIIHRIRVRVTYAHPDGMGLLPCPAIDGILNQHRGPLEISPGEHPDPYAHVIYGGLH